MAIKNLADAFCEELADIYSAEKQLVEALPAMVENASSQELKDAFQAHLEETREQVKRVERAFDDTGKNASAKTCEAMKGLIEECEGLIKEDAEAEVKDALLITAAQKVEHYEIASYGALCSWAEELGYKNALSLLQQNIDEEKSADEKLILLARTINKQALSKAA